MAKRASRQPGSIGLFDALPVTPVLVASGSSFSPAQLQRQRLAASSLQLDIARFQQQLANELVSWEQKDHQVIEANVALSFTLKGLAEFLPADLQPLIVQFLDLRAHMILREVEER